MLKYYNDEYMVPTTQKAFELEVTHFVVLLAKVENVDYHFQPDFLKSIFI